MVSVLFVCLGNICRSPLAECVFRHLVQKHSACSELITRIDSCGTGGHFAGNSPHEEVVREAAKHGIKVTGRARQIQPNDLVEFDLIVAMDEENLQDLRMMATNDAMNDKLSLLTEFTQADNSRKQVNNVPDPYYTGRFDVTYSVVFKGCEGLIRYISKIQA